MPNKRPPRLLKFRKFSNPRTLLGPLPSFINFDQNWKFEGKVPQPSPIVLYLALFTHILVFLVKIFQPPDNYLIGPNFTPALIPPLPNF